MAAKGKNRAEFERWMRQAERDLESARSNAKAGFHEWACFISQQAAEKALKAFLYGKGERTVVGHSILALLNRVDRYSPIKKGLKNAKRLDEVYIPSRYPNGLEEGSPTEFYDHEDAKQCIELAALVISRVKGQSGT